MLRVLLLGVLLVPATVLACEGKKKTASVDDTKAAIAAAHAEATNANAANCAKKAELMGTACSYTTGMMAQRVLAEGKPYAFTGRLVLSENHLPSKVAAPYTVGPDGHIHVVANEVVERLNAAGAQEKRLTMTGKLLELQGVQYFVLTTFDGSST